MPDEELEDNKAFMTGSMPLGLETNESIANRVLDMELFKLGLDYLQRYKDTVMALSAADVQAAAKRYLNPDCYVLATAGPD